MIGVIPTVAVFQAEGGISRAYGYRSRVARIPTSNSSPRESSACLKSFRLGKSRGINVPLVSRTHQYGQSRIFLKPSIRERQLTHHKHRPAVRLHPPRMAAIRTKPGVSRFRKLLVLHSRRIARPPESFRSHHHPGYPAGQARQRCVHPGISFWCIYLSFTDRSCVHGGPRLRDDC